MRKGHFRFAIAALLAVSTQPASAQPRTADPAQRGLALTDFPRLVKLADNVYGYEAIRSPGFTTVSLFVVGRNGVLLADGQGNAQATQALLDRIRTITDLPVRWYVVGSDHGDHTGGNAVLPKDLTWVVHPTSRAQLFRDSAAAAAIPAMSGDEQLIDLGGITARILFLGRAHTGGDLVVHLPREKILFMSEAYLNRVFPAMRSAYPSEWVRMIDRALAMEVARYVPGHGFIEEPTASREELVAFRKALVAVIAEAKRLHVLGLSAADAAKQADWGEYRRWLLAEQQAPIVIRKVYEEIEGKLAPPPARDPLAGFTGHGVSRELAVWRARTIKDVRYALRLDLTALDSALGRVRVRFKRSGTADVILDFRGRRLLRTVANGHPLGSGAFNGNHVRPPAQVLRSGENEVLFEFVTAVAPSGASIIRAHDPDGSDYLYTLLVPADANQLFPCFDQPDLKARVTLELVTPRAWKALANGSVAHADTAGDRVTTGFTETKPLSTYLIAFAAGPWERAASTEDGRTVNVHVRRSRAKEADLDSLLALNHRALRWMEGYFGRPYPFEKFDFVLSPAFPFGGMEQPGVVMYNEDRFIFRERPTLTRRLGRFSTILHEVAHQWFGDLVTMRWFDDLWLKEGFATYMAAKALAELEPTSDAWKTFYQSNKPAAYGVDQTTGTTPLWQAMPNLDQAKSAYGAIVYNKAPSVLKQLNYLVGEAAFRAGVRQFLSDHAYGNATWQQLLGAVGKAASKPMDAFGRNFMLRPGMPVVEQRLVVKDDRIERLELVQRPAKELSGETPWPMQTQVLLAYRDQPAVKIPVELTARVTAVASARGRPAPAFVFANAEDYGYFLTLLDDASVQALEQGAFAWVNDGFLRSMLWGALWDQVRDARMKPARFARLVLAELPRERDEQIVPGMLSRLERTMKAYLADDAREAIEPEVERVLWTLAGDTAKPYGIRKASLDAFIAVASTPPGVATLESLMHAESAAGEPVRDPTRWDIVNRLLVLDADEVDGLVADQVARDTTPDGRRRAFIAGAARRSPDVKREYFGRYFADRSLNEDWASGSLGAFNTTEHRDLTLPLLRPALDSLPFIQANRRIFFLGAWLGAFVNGQQSEAALETVREYLAAHPKLPKDLREKVLQQADELERTVRIRKRWN